jgi:SH3 domain protein
LKIVSTLLLLLLSTSSLAQEVRFISDRLLVPLRSGQGDQYRIIHRGLGSGLRLEVDEVNEESGYSHVTTPDGTQGWILSQYLVSEEPPRQQLARTRKRNQALQAEQSSLQARLAELQNNYQANNEQLLASQAQLEKTATELADVQRVSANALSLDADNRRLIEQVELLKTQIEVLEGDNLRLSESNESQAFYNGVFAVMLGVIITLLIPRLWPQRRPSSNWA